MCYAIHFSLARLRPLPPLVAPRAARSRSLSLTFLSLSLFRLSRNLLFLRRSLALGAHTRTICFWQYETLMKFHLDPRRPGAWRAQLFVGAASLPILLQVSPPILNLFGRCSLGETLATTLDGKTGICASQMSCGRRMTPLQLCERKLVTSVASQDSKSTTCACAGISSKTPRKWVVSEDEALFDRGYTRRKFCGGSSSSNSSNSSSRRRRRRRRRVNTTINKCNHKDKRNRKDRKARHGRPRTVKGLPSLL